MKLQLNLQTTKLRKAFGLSDNRRDELINSLPDILTDVILEMRETSPEYTSPTQILAGALSKIEFNNPEEIPMVVLELDMIIREVVGQMEASEAADDILEKYKGLS